MMLEAKESRKSGDKDQRILEAAKILFARYGVKKTSIEEIAQRAGLGKGTVYLYFKSKDDIFKSLVRRMASDLMSSIEESIRPLSSPREKLRLFIFTRLRYFDKFIREYGVTAEVVMETDSYPAIEDIRREFGQGQVMLLRSIIEEGRDAGDFQTASPEITAFAIYTALEGLSRPWKCQERELGLDEKINATIDLFLNGLGKR